MPCQLRRAGISLVLTLRPGGLGIRMSRTRRNGHTRLLSKVDYAVRLMIKNLPLLLPGYLELSYPYKDANTSPG